VTIDGVTPAYGTANTKAFINNWAMPNKAVTLTEKASDVTMFDLTTPANVTGTWTATNGETGAITASTANQKVPSGATVTLTSSDTTFADTHYTKVGDQYVYGQGTGGKTITFTMNGNITDLDDDWYEVTVNVDGTDTTATTNLAGVTVGTSFAAQTMVQSGVATNVVFTLGGTGTVANNPIKIEMTAVTGVASSKYGSADSLLAVGETQATNISGKADSITITAATPTNKTLTITYTLSST